MTKILMGLAIFNLNSQFVSSTLMYRVSTEVKRISAVMKRELCYKTAEILPNFVDTQNIFYIELLKIETQRGCLFEFVERRRQKKNKK